MGAVTEISWCDSSFNPWIGCTRVSPACDDCYAARSTPARAMSVQWGAGMPRHRTSADTWALPRKWNDRAALFCQCLTCGHRGYVAKRHDDDGFSVCAACGKNRLKPARRRVFCASLADVFDNEVDPAWRAELFALIDATPNLDWLLLTKRIGNVARLRPQGFLLWPHVWLGITVVNQEEADRDIPKLLATPAHVRFLSIEPMLGPTDLRNHLRVCCGNPHPGGGGDGWMQPPDPPTCCGEWERGVDWVIAGGESGPHARPVHPDWIRSLRDQCAAAGVAFHFKQWGSWSPTEVEASGRAAWVAADGRGIAEVGSDEAHKATLGKTDTTWWLAWNVGKKAAGRELDDRTHDAFPTFDTTTSESAASRDA